MVNSIISIQTIKFKSITNTSQAFTTINYNKVCISIAKQSKTCKKGEILSKCNNNDKERKNNTYEKFVSYNSIDNNSA